ncbi:hypothetical protein F7P69_00870 [Cellulosimicrobium funkei]|nr:hypothetical protein [Cellulosimicrobium funkei]
MSRRQPRAYRPPVVAFVCTGQDSHKVRRLMVADYVNGIADVDEDRGTAVPMRITADRSGLRLAWRMRCPSCGREERIDADRLQEVAGRAVSAGVRKLDVSKVS